jgi:hypothetical protein
MVNQMNESNPLNKISVIIPKSKRHLEPIERLMKIAGRRDRSVNFLAIEGILQYLEQHED